MAASALRKVLRGDNSSKLPIDIIQETESRAPSKTEPLSGWADGVSLQRSHCCILLKPQIILSGEASEDECIVAAAQAKLESFAIMDLANLEDPISGKIMSRCVIFSEASTPSNHAPGIIRHFPGCRHLHQPRHDLRRALLFLWKSWSIYVARVMLSSASYLKRKQYSITTNSIDYDWEIRLRPLLQNSLWHRISPLSAIVISKIKR